MSSLTSNSCILSPEVGCVKGSVVGASIPIVSLETGLWSRSDGTIPVFPYFLPLCGGSEDSGRNTFFEISVFPDPNGIRSEGLIRDTREIPDPSKLLWSSSVYSSMPGSAFVLSWPIKSTPPVNDETFKDPRVVVGFKIASCAPLGRTVLTSAGAMAGVGKVSPGVARPGRRYVCTFCQT